MKYSKHLILLVGPQGSGKTTYASEILNNYTNFEYISQDEQGKKGHMELFEQALKDGKNILVDRINHTRSQRRRYLELAEGYLTDIRVMNKPYSECLSNLFNRSSHPTLANDKGAEQLKSALSMYFKDYQYVLDEEADVVMRLDDYDPFLLDISDLYEAYLVIGDVHGCLDELQMLVNKAEIDAESGKNAVVIAGDLPDRGPKIKELYEWIMEQPHVYCVMGNHDNKLLRYLKGNNVRIAHGLQATIDQCGLSNRQSEFAQKMRCYIESQPYIIKFDNNVVVHAGLQPHWPLKKQSKECLIYCRAYNPETQSFLDGDNWFDHYEGLYRVFFGHNKHDRVDVKDNIFSMDGGCVHGGEMRGAKIISNSIEFFYVKAKEEYTPNTEIRNDLANLFEPFEKLCSEGYLRRQETDDLVLYNYTDKCTYDRHWNEYTMRARGIIFDKVTGELIAKPFPKFFNLNEQEQVKYNNLPSENYRVYDKLDGSLGIVFNYNGKWQVATRGSFISDQAKKAQEILKNYDLSKVSKGKTLLVEIIYPDNKIIVDYGEEKLVGLAIFNRKDESEIDPEIAKNIFSSTGMDVATEYQFSIDEMIEMQQTLPKDREGFVVRYDSGLRVKIKGEEYMRLSRMISRLSPLSLWQAMVGGKISRKFLEQLPEEFRAEYETITDALEANYSKILKEIRNDYESLPIKNTDPDSRKEIGLFLHQNNGLIRHPKVVFHYLNNKRDKVDYYIMQQIRPKGNIL